MTVVPTLIADDGVEIHFETWGDAASGPPVVLQHGFSASAEREWLDSGMVSALLAAGRRVVALDARGHGRSGKPLDSAFYGEPRMARDIVAVLDTLGVVECDVVGYSMGAIVSLFVAATDPRVRRLVVGGVGAAVVELGGLERRVLDPEALREALLVDDPSTVTNPGAASFRSWIDASGADRFALAAAAGKVHRGHVPLELITAPTLVLAGRADELAQRPHVLADAISGAQLVLLEGGHGEVLRDPAFLDAIVRFVMAEDARPAAG